MGNAAAPGAIAAGAAGLQDCLRDYGPAGAVDIAAEPLALQDLPGPTGRPGAAEADIGSAESAVPSDSEGLLAGWRRRQTMPEYTVASKRLDHATFLERANASV